MTSSNQLNIAGVDPRRVDRVVADRLQAVPVAPRLIALPVILAGGAALYAGVAPLWMFVIPPIFYLTAVYGAWRSQHIYRRDPEARSFNAWRWNYLFTSLPQSFASGLLGGFFATLPGSQEHTLWAFALCLIAGWTPSRALDGRTYMMAGAALLLPIVSVLALADGSRNALALAEMLLGFYVILNLFAHVERKRVREQIARDLAAADLSQTLDQAHRDVAFAQDTMRTVLDNMSDGALLYEGNGRWLYQNKAMAALHDMPDALLKTLPTFADIVRYRAHRGD